MVVLQPPHSLHFLSNFYRMSPKDFTIIGKEQFEALWNKALAPINENIPELPSVTVLTHSLIRLN